MGVEFVVDIQDGILLGLVIAGVAISLDDGGHLVMIFLAEILVGLLVLEVFASVNYHRVKPSADLGIFSGNEDDGSNAMLPALFIIRGVDEDSAGNGVFHIEGKVAVGRRYDHGGERNPGVEDVAYLNLEGIACQAVEMTGDDILLGARGASKQHHCRD